MGRSCRLLTSYPVSHPQTVFGLCAGAVSPWAHTCHQLGLGAQWGTAALGFPCGCCYPGEWVPTLSRSFQPAADLRQGHSSPGGGRYPMGTRGIIVPSVLVLNLSREGAVPFRLLRRDTLLAIAVRVTCSLLF